MFRTPNLDRHGLLPYVELASVLHAYRLRWMTRVLERENRIADTVALQTVMRSDNLFITTTLLIIAGLISSLGAVERIQAMVSADRDRKVGACDTATQDCQETFVVRRGVHLRMIQSCQFTVLVFPAAE